jgi:hypothetical protein
LLQDSGLERIYRLMILASEERSDRFKTFLFTWTALEILICKTFNLYFEAFVNQIETDALSETARELQQRLQNNIEEKCSLRDKFIASSSILSEDADSDLTIFSPIKKIRDRLIHVEAVDDENLPVDEVMLLLRKLLTLHLLKAHDTVNNAPIS